MNGLVVTVRAVARFRNDFELFIRRDAIARTRKGRLHAAKAQRFLGRRLTPGARNDVGRECPGSEQVHRHHGELHASAARTKEHIVSVRDRKELAQAAFELRHYARHLRSAMARFQNRPTAAMKIKHLRLNLL